MKHGGGFAVLMTRVGGVRQIHLETCLLYYGEGGAHIYFKEVYLEANIF